MHPCIANRNHDLGVPPLMTVSSPWFSTRMESLAYVAYEALSTCVEERVGALGLRSGFEDLLVIEDYSAIT